MSNWQQEGQGGGAAEEGGSTGGGTEEGGSMGGGDEGGSSDKPADVDWDETESSPHAGEEGQEPV
jgi:hypothetical protein